ncbi:MAG: GH32 C-terminal domain-containing protein [Clostridiales bacterium]|nr:GH32 C-terminal domain-containing protein [Clostridiales bacterium]
MKKRVWTLCLLACFLLVTALSGCSGETGETGESGGDQSADSAAQVEENLLLYLPFDEGTGTAITDASGNLPEGELSYTYTNALYMDSQDPQWRTDGVSGGSLLFDGNSTCISYSKNDIQVEGSVFSVSVWFAPRTFEWDDPYAEENGTQALTGIVSQCSKDSCTGFQLGYQRYGKLCFEVGTGEEWLTLWGDANLEKYEWNCVTAVFDGENGQMSLYLNGECVGSMEIAQGSAIAPANQQLLVGRSCEASRLGVGYINMCSGLMDELKLYNEALSAETVAEAYGAVTVPEIDFDAIWLQNILTEDEYKPQYHGGPYQYWMNEPHSPVYYNGKYHLFFQQNMSGTYWRNICWGHLVSDDMVNWTPVEEAIVPTEDSVVPDGVWSGNAAYDVNGVPLLFFTAGNDAYATDGLISNQNIGVAYPADLSDPNLVEWVIYDELAVVQQEGQGRACEFRDPYVWEHEGAWYMLICSGSSTSNGGSALLYKTETLELLPDGTIDMDWQYIGPIYEMENQSMTYGTSWELPILLTLSNEDGTVTKDVFIISPAPASSADNKVYYFIGTFDYETGTFTPDEAYADGPAILDYGDNVFTGPSAYVDAETGETYLFSIMQDQRSVAEQGAAGWAHNVGLARQIWLNDDGSDLKVSPTDALHDLETEVLIDETDLTAEEADALLQEISGDMLYIRVTFTDIQAEKFGIDLLESEDGRDVTDFYYTTGDSTIHGETANRGDGSTTSFVSGALELDDGSLTMEIYLDRSLVEAFFNDTKAISMRAYPEGEDSDGLSLFAEGGDVTVQELYVAEMGSIYTTE